MSTTLRPRPFSFILELLAQIIVRTAHTNSMTVVEEEIIAHYWRSDYIIRVLEAPADIRAEVKTEAIANVAADPNLPEIEGQRQLVCILAVFEALPAAQRVDFIDAFREAATLGGYGLQNVVLENVWQWGQQPPVIPP